MKYSKSLQWPTNMTRVEQDGFIDAKFALQENCNGLSTIFKVDKILMQSCLRSDINTPQALTKKINLDKRSKFMATDILIDLFSVTNLILGQTRT
jgi:hypothetical protein